MMDALVSLAEISEEPVLRNLMELYLYDFSEFDGADLGSDGLYGYPYLTLYWIEENRYPFLIRRDGKLVGFVLVSHHDYLGDDPTCWVIAEFFILRKYRQRGLGEFAAHQIFDRFPGDWHVGQLNTNPSATIFWRKVIHRYTAGHYHEVLLDNDDWHGPVQIFRSPSSRNE